MDFPIHSAAIRWAEELLSLYRAYSTAGYDLLMMRDSALHFEEMDLRRYANTDQMPIRINGQLYAVSEQASSSVVSTSIFMLQVTMWEGVHDPRSTAIRCMEYLLPQLRRGRTVTISATSDRSGIIMISAPGSSGQEFPGFTIVVIMLGLHVSDFDPNRLIREDVRLIPI
jgi:hypothetical protein